MLIMGVISHMLVMGFWGEYKDTVYDRVIGVGGGGSRQCLYRDDEQTVYGASWLRMTGRNEPPTELTEFYLHNYCLSAALVFQRLGLCCSGLHLTVSSLCVACVCMYVRFV